MKTYLINLDRNPERLAFERQQLSRIGLEAERFPAVYGKGLSSEEYGRQFSRSRSFVAMRRRMSPGEIGCALSHIGVCREMLKRGEPLAMVIEDDVFLSDGLTERMREVERIADPSRPQVYTFSDNGNDASYSAEPEIRSVKSIWCTDGYCLTKAAAELILAKNYPVISVADSFKRWRRCAGLELYRVYPTAVRQNDEVFGSETLRPPKANWLVRNLMWVVDWVLCKVTGR